MQHDPEEAGQDQRRRVHGASRRGRACRAPPSRPPGRTDEHRRRERHDHAEDVEQEEDPVPGVVDHAGERVAARTAAASPRPDAPPGSAPPEPRPLPSPPWRPTPLVTSTSRRSTASRARSTSWLTTFHLAVVILDPYTYESAWLLETAGRILDNFRGADCRIAFVVTADADDAREFLGPWARRSSPSPTPTATWSRRSGSTSCRRSSTCARTARSPRVAEGWDPPEWQHVAVRAGQGHELVAPEHPRPRRPRSPTPAPPPSAPEPRPASAYLRTPPLVMPRTSRARSSSSSVSRPRSRTISRIERPVLTLSLTISAAFS